MANADNAQLSEQQARDIAQLGPILLYDGECGVCSASVQWILNHERSGELRFAALQSELGQQLRRMTGVGEDVDSLLWVQTRGESLEASMWSSAVLHCVNYVGGPWRLLGIARLIPRGLRDVGYRLFARHRTRFAPTQCLLPPPQTRLRFLDQS